MDINRYYVPPKPRRESLDERDKKHEAATSRFMRNTTRLPTPEGFFARQRAFKEADKRAMMRFAKKKVVKHNLQLRRKELKTKKAEAIVELKEKITEKPKKVEEVKEDVEVTAVTNEDGEVTGFSYPGLKAALEEKDEDEVNKEILKKFFEIKDPKRVEEVDDLLKENEGKEFELFDEIAKKYNVVRANPNYKRNDRKNGSANPATSNFVETPVTEAKEDEKKNLRNSKGKDEDLRKSKAEGKKMLKKPRSTLTINGKLRAGSIINNKSVMTIDTMNTAIIESDDPAVKEFQKALDAEIRQKHATGEYVTSIKERGGRWWVNRQPTIVHPSRRRRNTLLDDLREGNVPLSL